MSDKYTETVTTSYGGNVKKAFGGLIAGLILFIASFFVLWINEGSNAHQIKLINYINDTVVVVSSESIDKVNDNKLIALSASAAVQNELSDGIISIKDALVLDRTVEMYQWKENKETETTKKVGGGTTEKTTYSYSKQWSEQEINSEDFKKTGYVNPQFTVKSKRLNALSGSLGAFKLSETQTKKIGNLKELTSLPENANYEIIDEFYYKGNDYANPQVGDVRISYSYVPSGAEISVIGKQMPDGGIEPMISDNGTIYIQYGGNLTKDEMIAKFKKQNSIKTWVFRFFGWLLMFFGLSLIINPLVVVASFIPFLSEIIGFASSAVLFVISVILSIITIGVAWLAYRPLMAVLMFAAAAVLVVLAKGLISKVKNKKSE